MEIQITNIKKKDYKKAIQFAKTGMHFDLYLDNKFLLYLYGNYFWYDELNRATQVIAAYVGEELAGVLLADIEGEKKSYRSFGKTMYIQIFNLLQKLFYKGGAGVYDTTNQVLFREYRKCHCPDGQIVFLAANPAFQQKGIGSKLLEELERREKGKQVYLYTDDACLANNSDADILVLDKDLQYTKNRNGIDMSYHGNWYFKRMQWKQPSGITY